MNVIWDRALITPTLRSTGMGVRTLGVERDLLAVPPCPHVVHVSEPHVTFNSVERLAMVG